MGSALRGLRHFVEEVYDIEGRRLYIALGQGGVNLSAVMGLMIEQRDQNVIAARLSLGVAANAPVANRFTHVGVFQCIDLANEPSILLLSSLAQFIEAVVEDHIERTDAVRFAVDPPRP